MMWQEIEQLHKDLKKIKNKETKLSQAVEKLAWSGRNKA